MGKGDDRDPIQRAAGAGRDLYDVATWEPRTKLDGIATSVYGGILASGRALLILVASLIVLSQFVFTGITAIRNPLLGVYVLLSIVPALLLAVILWRSDVNVREPLEKLVITFLLGFVFAGFAAVFNSTFQGLFLGFGAIGTVLFFFLIVGPIEESVKLLAVRIHAYRSDQFDAVIDGAIYGAVAGLGFAAIENTIYITGQYLTVAGIGGSAGVATLQTTAVRTFAGPGHVIYSAFAGYYLGLAKFNPEHRGPIIVKGLLIAVFIHATYNTVVSNLGLFLGFVPVLAALPPSLAFLGFILAYDGFFFLVLYAKIRKYRRVFDEVGAGSAYPRAEGRGDSAEPSLFDR
ncbi:MAG: PrsW family intramembrane metalloprotease [Halodesulfurarchaeum sp.]